MSLAASPPLCASVRQQWYVYEEIECFEMHFLIPYAHKKTSTVCVYCMNVYRGWRILLNILSAHKDTTTTRQTSTTFALTQS